MAFNQISKSRYSILGLENVLTLMFTLKKSKTQTIYNVITNCNIVLEYQRQMNVRVDLKNVGLKRTYQALSIA